MKFPVILLFVLLSVGGLCAESISINFHNSKPANQIQQVTGMYEDGDWNEIEIAETGEQSLDTAGATIKWEAVDAPSGKNPTTGVATSFPDRIFRTQLRTNSGGEGGLSITVTDLPEALAENGYDVLVYWQNSKIDENPDIVQTFRINDEMRVLVTKKGNPNYKTFEVGNEETVMDALDRETSTNVAVFPSLKGDSFTLTTERQGIEGVPRSRSNGGVAAIQIIPAQNKSAE